MSYVVGIDVGGTFSDLFAWDQRSNTIRAAKALSTVTDQLGGILLAIVIVSQVFKGLRERREVSQQM